MALANPPPSDLMASLMGPPEPLSLGYSDADPDYVPAPKFDKTYVVETATELKADHSVRIAQAREYAQFLGCADPGIFSDDRELVDDEIMEAFPLLGAREEYEFRRGYLAGHQAYPRLRNRDLVDRRDAMAVEDLVAYWFGCEERRYARQHRADLRMDEAAHLLRYGMLVGLDVLDPDDPSGIYTDLLDPLTVFPVWGGPHGLLECYRVYEDTNENIIGTYGGKPGSKEYRRIEEAVKKTATTTKRGRRTVMTRGEMRTVIEAISYDELFVVLDEEHVLLQRSHGYRRVPITIWIGAFDQPAGVSIGTENDVSDARAERTAWGEVTVSGRSMDLARQLRPYAWRQMWAHRIAEAVAGRRLSYFKWSNNPHIIREYDPTQKWQLGERPSLMPGEMTDVPIPSKINLVAPVMDTVMMQGLAADLQSNASGGGFLTQMRLGQIPPQTSGSAMGKLQELGGSGDVVLVRALQGFKQARAEWRLELMRTHGDAVGSPLGVIRTPARDGYSSPLHEVTPELLGRSGTEVDIELYMEAVDVAAAQYITTLRAPGPTTGKPLISDETAQRRLKLVPDIEREADRINAEARGSLPPIAQQRDIAALQEMLAEAQDAGDHETAADIMISIGELTFLHEQSVAKGEAAPPPGSPPPMPGVLGAGTPAPPPPGGGGGPALPGTSLPDQGIGVGTQGGAPSGPPQAMTSPTPVGQP